MRGVASIAGMAEYDNQLEPNHPEPLWREVTDGSCGDTATTGVNGSSRPRNAPAYPPNTSRTRTRPGDASSEILAAVAGALGLTLVDLVREVAVDLVRQARPVPVLRSVPGGPAAVPGHRSSRGPYALAA